MGKKVMTIYENIDKAAKTGLKQFALLIDPEKFNILFLQKILNNSYNPDYIFVGGSQFTESVYNIIEEIKSITSIPIVMFPGNASQFANNADAILFLFLASGRNSKFLIEQQIVAAQKIKDSNIETIPTGYILINGDKISAVEKVSETIPYNQNEINLIKDTAIACQLLGNKLIYLEAGSGAITCVRKEIISSTKKAINIPLIVGGGIKTTEQIINAYDAGADLVVVGNHIEKHPEDFKLFIETVNKYNKTTL